jgi:hypothetical protein
MSQLARVSNELGRSTGTWILTSGTDIAQMCDETLSDGTTTEFATPSTVATHSCTLKFGTSWNGAALARPYINTLSVLRVDVRYVTGAVDLVVKIVEGATNNTDGTVRDTWTIGTLGVNVYTSAGSVFRREIPSASIDAISDFTALSARLEYTNGTSGRRGAGTYVSIEMPSPNAPTLGRYTLDLAGLTALPPEWQLVTISALVPALPVVSSSVDAPSASSVLIYTCSALDLTADCRAMVRCSSGYNNTKSRLGSFIRQNPGWDVFGTDSWRYDDVPNEAAATPAYELKYDGAISSVLVSTAFTSVANLVAGDTHETRAVGTTISGWKNGVQIHQATDSTITAYGLCGVVHSPFGTTPWVGWDYFEMESVPAWGGPLVGGRLIGGSLVGGRLAR